MQAQAVPAHAETASPPHAAAGRLDESRLGLAQLGEGDPRGHEVNEDDGGIILDPCVDLLDGSEHLVRRFLQTDWVSEAMRGTGSKAQTNKGSESGQDTTANPRYEQHIRAGAAAAA